MFYYKNIKRNSLFQKFTDIFSLTNFNGYVNPIVRIREDSGNTEEDFSAPLESSVTTFLDGADGYIRYLYNQKTGEDIGQNTALSQPQYIEDYFGTGLHGIEFFGTGQRLSSASSSVYNADLIMHTVYIPSSTTNSNSRLIELSDSSVDPQMVIATSGQNITINYANGVFESFANYTTAGNKYLITYHKYGSSLNWTIDVYVNGSLLTSYNLTSDTPDITYISIGANYGATSIDGLVGHIASVLISENSNDIIQGNVVNQMNYLKNLYSI